jgi:hypothetical protein
MTGVDPISPGDRKRACFLSAAPMVALVDTWQDELAVLESHAPHGETTSTKRKDLDDLRRRIDDARNATVFVSIEELHELTGKPPSTLSRICRDYGKAIGAQKVNGVWLIHWPTFEKFLMSGIQLQKENAA